MFVVQDDGTPPHFALPVIRLRAFRTGWIGRIRPIVMWPPKLPDLTSSSFFLWRSCQKTVYATQLKSLDDKE